MQGKLSEALEGLQAIEKQQRQAGDVMGAKMVLVAIVRACYEQGNWKEMKEQAIAMSKRRAQLKRAVAEMVREVASYLDEAPDVETETETIKTLTDIATGKIFLEVEKARLTRRLAAIHESQGKVEEASETLQEVAVETYGGMSKREKVSFILEQMRLLLQRRDYDQAQIMSKKVQPRTFDDLIKGKRQDEAEGTGGSGIAIGKGVEIPEPKELKRRYYTYRVWYHDHHNEYLESCRCYQAMYEEAANDGDEELWRNLLQRVCWLVILSQRGPMQQSLLHQTHRDRKLAEMPLYYELIDSFVRQEIIHWRDFLAKFDGETKDQSAVFGGEHADKRRNDLHSRVIEHNCIVVSQYYSRLTLNRLSELLDLPVDEAESRLADAIVNKLVTAKIDRPAGTISFSRNLDSSEHLNSWVSSIDKLLWYLESASHLLHKEAMAHGVDLTPKS